MWTWLKNRLARTRHARREVVVYSRSGCHLCDEACELLRQHGLRPKTIDIDADAALRERFTHCVPVVFLDGHERFRGRVNPVLLQRLLRHPPTA